MKLFRKYPKISTRSYLNLRMLKTKPGVMYVEFTCLFLMKPSLNGIPSLYAHCRADVLAVSRQSKAGVSEYEWDSMTDG